jgi:hypothetical protein
MSRFHRPDACNSLKIMSREIPHVISSDISKWVNSLLTHRDVRVVAKFALSRLAELGPFAFAVIPGGRKAS